MPRLTARGRREDARVDAFLAAIRGQAQPATTRADTVLMPRIVLRTAVPPGGWAVAG